MQKRWIVLDSPPPEFSEAVHPHPVLRQLFWHRGVRTSEDVESFLHPLFDQHIHDPFLFQNMQTAVERVFLAMEKCEKILLFGDYDADGLTGSTVVIATIRDIHQRMANDLKKPLRFKYYIPHRDKEGYGLQMTQAEQFVREGHHLVITVDCGISCVAEIERLKKGGVETIVVDHHQFGEVLPDAILIHPSIPGEIYPFKHLAAVGVAWKFACALLQEARKRGVDIPEGHEKWLLDLVAIATVTDIVPLVGENRVLETYGLKVLNRTKRPGLRALIHQTGLIPGHITARDIGFVIGPRLNAPSRMDHAIVGLELLLSTSEEEASVVASRLESLNRDRQDAVLVMMREAEELLEAFPKDAAAYVLWRDDWSPALVGLVAGRLSDRFGVPVVAIGKHGKQWIGSGRSYPHYDITEAVKRAGEGLLTRSGGHVQACGFALADDENVPVFAERLRADAAVRISSEQIGPMLEIHAEMPLAHLNWDLLEVMSLMEPYGAHNVSPVFLTRDLEIVTSATIGKDGKHLRIVAKSLDGTTQPFIAFGFGSRVGEAMHGSHIDIVYTVSESEWNGRRDIQCKIVDFRSTES